MGSPKMNSSFKFDLESGTSSPGRFARRFLARRVRWIFGAVAAATLVLLLTDLGGQPGRPPRLGLNGDGDGAGDGQWEGEGKVGELEDIWNDKQVGAGARPKGWDWGFKLPFGAPDPLASAEGPSGGSGGAGKATNMATDSYIAPMHPDLSLLPLPSALFPEVSLPAFLTPPMEYPFPEARLREIISDPPEEVVRAPPIPIPPRAFSQEWVGPEVWDQPRGQVRPVQSEGFAEFRESEEERTVREERREAVRRGFVWAWQAYKRRAWGEWAGLQEGEKLTGGTGHDEVKPISEIPSNPFNKWVASAVVEWHR